MSGRKHKRKKIGRPSLGRNHLRWCSHCGLPILDDICGICGGITSQVDITPPYDVRPAFRYDIERINSCSIRQFGVPLVEEGEAVVLSSTPSLDRMDEVVAGGEVLATLRFELGQMRWVLLPRVKGALRLLRMGASKSIIELDVGAFDAVLGGGSVLAPGVLHADPSIEKGDELLILSNGRLVGCGRARMKGDAMVGGRGVAVKVRWRNKDSFTPEDAPLPIGYGKWEDVRDAMVVANTHALDGRESEAMNFIKHTAEEYAEKGMPPTVSYSGGKDSLAVLVLTLKTLGKVDVLFIDTGIEFPETYDNIEMVKEYFGDRITFYTGGGGDPFWRGF